MDEVIERARSGDADALGHLWRTYHHLLLRYFRGKGMRDPEDLAQTVWIEVAAGLERFAGGEHDFRRWLFTIAARRRIDDIRAAQRRRSERLESAPTEAPPQREGSNDASEAADRAMALERAVQVVRSLPPDQAEAVLLRIVADLSVRDVAELMGRREGSVRVLVHRGLQRRREHPDVTKPTTGTMSSP